MRNRLCALVSCVFIFTTSYGGSAIIDVTYNTFDGTNPDKPTFINPDNTAAFDFDSLVMAYWTPDQDTIGFNALNPGEPGSNNILLNHFGSWDSPGAHQINGHVTNEIGFVYNSDDYGVGNIADGYVYFAVFDVPYAEYLVSGMPAIFQYAVAPMMSTDPGAPNSLSVDAFIADPPSLPNEIGIEAAGYGPYGMIPEPGTLALFVIGSTLFIGLRRRKLAGLSEE